MTRRAVPPVSTVATQRPDDPCNSQARNRRSSPGPANELPPGRGQLVHEPPTVARPVRGLTAGSDAARAQPAIPAVLLNRPDPPDKWPLRSTDPVTVGGYQVLARLGSGGTADVFYARGFAGRPVAIKVFRGTDGSAEICRREFRFARAVDSHCTAPVLGYGVSAVGAYLVTTYLPGYRCGSTLAYGATPADPAWRLAAGLAGTLAAIHARGVIHCDVKPSNLLVRGDDVRLIDFGIACAIGHRRRADSLVEYSRGWAAPEQLTVVAPTPAADVFAWGCVIAYLTSGIHPFASVSAQEWMLRVRSAEPDLCELPSGLAEVVAWSLMRNPSNRPSALELAAVCRARRSSQPARAA